MSFVKGPAFTASALEEWSPAGGAESISRPLNYSPPGSRSAAFAFREEDVEPVGGAGISPTPPSQLARTGSRLPALGTAHARSSPPTRPTRPNLLPAASAVQTRLPQSHFLRRPASRFKKSLLRPACDGGRAKAAYSQSSAARGLLLWALGAARSRCCVGPPLLGVRGRLPRNLPPPGGG